MIRLRPIQHNTLMGFTPRALIEDMKQQTYLLQVFQTVKGGLWDRCGVSVDSMASEVWCLFSPL